jgi:hypothetical protein
VARVAAVVAHPIVITLTAINGVKFMATVNSIVVLDTGEMAGRRERRRSIVPRDG